MTNGFGVFCNIYVTSGVAVVSLKTLINRGRRYKKQPFLSTFVNFVG